MSDQEWKMRVINAISEADYEIVAPFLAEAEAAVNWQAERADLVAAIRQRRQQIALLIESGTLPEISSTDDGPNEEYLQGESDGLYWVLNALGETP